MRKALKNNLLEIFKTIYEAHEIVKGFIDKKEYENAQNLLADCQDTAIQIGNLIEESEGEGFVTVSYLEEYCEALYEAATNLSEETNGHKVRKQLDKNIIKAENSAKNDIKVKLEIVFMPYKASMWDSLESVWKAADEDPDCDAYVVPIPYYDRKPDGAFGEYHYEGGDYPDYVPVVHYEAYDLEQRRPDAIYIHNPYDGNNRVTSVDPRFYSSVLKKYTECLAYIPYCVYDESENINSTNICQRYITSGICNSDKVILQSEKFRDAIINTIMTRSNMKREFWENRIVAIGSPKYDKVLQLEDKLANIPEFWSKLIYNADGTKKKVVFYNTSLGALLKDTKQMLEKIESVINYFYEIKDEFVLLWRPHPLMRATMDSMRSDLSTRYNKIVDDYIAGGWGIYDDTPSYDMAFAVSDAYYGDYSSLVQLYQATGKPLLTQCVEVTDYHKGIVTDYMYYDGQYVWFTARNFNGLFKMDANTYKVEFVGQFPDEDVEEYKLYTGIAECNGKLYFAPYNAQNIAIYDKEKSSFYSITLRNDIKDIFKKFYNVLAFDKYIFIYGYKANMIIRIDSQTDTVNYMNISDDYNNSYYTFSSCIYNDKIYSVSPSNNSILCLNPLDMSYEFVKIDKEFDKCVFNIGITAPLLITNQGDTVYFDLENKQFINTGLKTTAICFAYELDRYIYLFNTHEKCITVINKESQQIDKFSLDFCPYLCCEIGGKKLIFGAHTNDICIFDTDSFTIENVEYDFDVNQLPQLNRTNMFSLNQKANRFARESSFFNLESLLEVLKDGNYDIKNSNDVCGNKIHEYVKGTSQ